MVIKTRSLLSLPPSLPSIPSLPLFLPLHPRQALSLSTSHNQLQERLGIGHNPIHCHFLLQRGHRSPTLGRRRDPQGPVVEGTGAGPRDFQNLLGSWREGGRERKREERSECFVLYICIFLEGEEERGEGKLGRRERGREEVRIT